ncbi:MAG: tRNA (guanine-N7)-methyltransferase [Bacteroidetes bacterium]|nr:tRNA (guanine-N7)-methyltransferase [Bacteroidota bacterium]
MGKNKLQKFRELEQLSHVFQISALQLRDGALCEMKSRWHEFFGNDNPIVLELGCGRGEYTVALGRRFPDKNYIGVDIKGARLWAGAKESFNSGMKNVAFVRTNIEMLPYFFGENEVSEIWLTFPDPQMKKKNKRLTGTGFLRRYTGILKPEGILHLKSDSNFMFTYTKAVIAENGLPVIDICDDIYALRPEDEILSIKTYYEQQWLARGITIKYIKFVLEPRTEWKEPEIEIEMDPYRSYGRNKRSELNLTD